MLRQISGYKTKSASAPAAHCLYFGNRCEFRAIETRNQEIAGEFQERGFWQFGSKWSPPLARETPNYFPEGARNPHLIPESLLVFIRRALPAAKKPLQQRGALAEKARRKCRYTANTTEQMLRRMAPNTKVNTIMGQTNLNQWDIFMSSICSVAITRPVGAM